MWSVVAVLISLTYLNYCIHAIKIRLIYQLENIILNKLVNNYISKMLEAAAQPIFLKYRNALLAIGVDFSDELITDLIEYCHQNLESRLQSVVAYYCWLQSQNKDVVDANKLFLQAFHEGWTPIGWQDDFLERDEFKSPAQKWWDKAKHIDVLKNIVVDVQSNFWSGGKVIFAYPSGQLFTLSLSRAMDMSWSEVIEYYERVTKVKVQQYPNRIIFQKPSANNN